MTINTYNTLIEAEIDRRGMLTMGYKVSEIWRDCLVWHLGIVTI